MSLIEQIDRNYQEAFKNREIELVNLLRLLKSSIKNEAIKIGNIDTILSDQQVIAVLSREAKQRKDSITQYRQGNRDDLAKKEEFELSIIESYLPKNLSDSDLNAIINDILKESGATQKNDMGKVMSLLKQKLTNPADISAAATIVSGKLQ